MFPEVGAVIAPITLVRFGTQADQTVWQSLGAPVMGGCSQGWVEPVDADTSAFTGIVRLENGGGFASVKADLPQPLDLSAYTGLWVHARGDGQRYKLGVRTRIARDAPVHQAPLTPQAGDWERLHLPWDAFTPTRRGRVLSVDEAGVLDGSAAASLSLFIFGGQAGPFRLDLAAIAAEG